MANQMGGDLLYEHFIAVSGQLIARYHTLLAETGDEQYRQAANQVAYIRENIPIDNDQALRQQLGLWTNQTP